MSKLPRILPLVGVAIAGVFAINALAGAQHLPDLIGAAKAFAETAPKAVKAKTAAAAQPAMSKAPVPATPPTQLAAAGGGAPAVGPVPPTPQLAPNADALCLASRAGLSPAEMKMIQDLQTRRGQLDQRESDLDLQLKLVQAAEGKVNVKLDELNQLKSDINKLLGQVDDKQAAETARLVKVYTNMKPQQAAAALAAMDDSVRLPIAAGMKEAVLGGIMTKMTAVQAKDLTEKLANRFAKDTTLARAATAPPGAAPAPAATSAAPAAPPAKGAAAKTPGPTAQATPPASPTASDAAAQAVADAAADAKAKPKKVASAPKRKPAKPKGPDPKDAAAPMSTKPDPTATG